MIGRSDDLAAWSATCATTTVTSVVLAGVAGRGPHDPRPRGRRHHRPAGVAGPSGSPPPAPPERRPTARLAPLLPGPVADPLAACGAIGAALAATGGDRPPLVCVDDAHLLDDRSAEPSSGSSGPRASSTSSPRCGEGSPRPPRSSPCGQERAAVATTSSPWTRTWSWRCARPRWVGPVEPLLGAEVVRLAGGLPGLRRAAPRRGSPARTGHRARRRVDARGPAHRVRPRGRARRPPPGVAPDGAAGHPRARRARRAPPRGLAQRGGGRDRLDRRPRAGGVAARPHQLSGQTLVSLGHPLTGGLLARSMPRSRRRALVEQLAGMAEAHGHDRHDPGSTRWRHEAGMAVAPSDLVGRHVRAGRRGALRRRHGARPGGLGRRAHAAPPASSSVTCSPTAGRASRRRPC